MIGHECIFWNKGGSAGRQKDRAVTKNTLTSMYIIYDKECMYIQMRGRSIFNPRSVYLPTCRPTSHPDYTYMPYQSYIICIEVNLYLLVVPALSICRTADPPLVLSIHSCPII